MKDNRRKHKRSAENGQASMLELAIDFELFSGLSMPLHGNAPKGVRERGNVLRCMMSALDKLAAQQGLRGKVAAKKLGSCHDKKKS
ncbi:hypothetical protein DIPPA_05081 [Diplonema papillatum]|nr:hypothetical protein DIPPA_05081 [Diplonema papillatum]